MTRAMFYPLATMGLLASLLSACAPYQARPVSRTAGEAVINPPRGDRGNPESYEVFGRTYYVMQSGDGYRDIGVASWYGDDFQGKSTSSGERYDMYAFTAAHKTLPIPTWVEVTNRQNGRTVIVKINDRGPFVDGRVIDLSYAAALQIGMVRQGTAPVFIRALGAPGNFPARMDPAVAEGLQRSSVPTASFDSFAGLDAGYGPAVDSSLDDGLAVGASEGPDGSSSGMFVQVGAYSKIENALKMVDRLQSNGFINSFLVSDERGARGLHRVRIGPLNGESHFDLVSDSLRAIGIRDAHLVVER